MAEAKDKQIPQLSPDSLKAFEYISTRHDALVPQGVNIEDLLNPAYWAHHAVKLRPWDEIRARAEDGTWVAFLQVLASDRTWARCQLLAKHNLGTADIALTQAAEEEVKRLKAEYKIAYAGPEKYRVVRRADNNVMQSGLQQKADAELWLERYVRDQVGAAPASSAAAVATT